MHVAGYTLTNEGVTRETKPNVTETRAHLAVSGPWSGTISSGDNQYVSPPEPSREVGIKTDWRRAEDLYVIVDETHADGSIFVQVLVKPLVNLIWVAGIVFVLGSLVALWPDAREQRRLVSRLVPAASAGS
jgi:cytochrome c biogenesis factor